MLRQSYNNNNKKKTKETKVLAKGPNLRVPHLVFILELGSEDCRATP